MAVVINQHHGFKPFVRTKRCNLRSYLRTNSTMFELDPTKLAHSLKQAVAVTNIHRSLSTPCLSLANKVDDEADTGPRVEIVGGRGALGIRALVVEAAIGMASGVDPIPVPSGLGGSYYLCNRNGDKIAVVKPIDEEPLAINNPKGYAGRILGQPGLKRSVRVGETGVREVAACLLDYDGFAGVPPTALVKISHIAFHVNDSTATRAPPLPKIASLQCFVDHDFDAGDLGPSSFSVSSVHRIGILDIRLLNLDRHAGNILVKKHNNNKDHCGFGVYNGNGSENYVVGVAELVPIDHGLCLPELIDDPYFEWLHWPQASVPFSESEAEYICRLDPLKDADLLRTELPQLRESSIRILVLCTIFLKRAVVAGLCLAEIGDMMTREYCRMEQGPSVLETLCAKAKANMNNVFKDNQSEEDNEDEMCVFQFDVGSEDSCADVLDLPRLLQNCSMMTKPPKIPIKYPSMQLVSRFPHKILPSLYEEDDNGNGYEDNDNDDDDNGDSVHDDGCRVGGLTKSVSFSVTKHNNETEGISFRGMSEDEWGLFLESFDKLLPKVFEGRKSMGLKQRLGTSCKF